MTKLVEQQLKRHMHAIMSLCQQTRKNKVEYGLTICRDGTRTKTCKGESCTVNLPECKDHIPFASAHSHPMGASNMPSSQDVILSLHMREPAFCICAPMRGKDFVRCYEFTKDQNTKDRYTKAFLEKDDNIMMDMIVKSIFRPDDTTLFRPIIDVVKKRKK